MTDFSLITNDEIINLTNSIKFEWLRNWGPGVAIVFLLFIVIISRKILLKSNKANNVYFYSSIIFNGFYHLLTSFLFIFFISIADGVPDYMLNISIIGLSIIMFFIYKEIVDKDIFKYQLEVMKLLLIICTIYFVISENVFSKVLVISALPYFGCLLISETKEKLNEYKAN